MMQPADKPCPNCEVLQRRVDSLERRLARLEAELAKAVFAQTLRKCPRLTVTPTTSRRNLRTVVNEQWQPPLRYATNAVSRGPISPALRIGAGISAYVAQAIYRVPSTNEAQNLAERFARHGTSYLQFITTPGIEPTNNLAEQAIRFVVIDRLVTQGSRSEAGRRWLERIWSAMATCAQQGRSVFEFLVDSVQSHFAGHSGPTLLTNTS